MHPASILHLQAVAEAVAITRGGPDIMARVAALGRRMGAEATDVRQWVETNPEVLFVALLVTILLLAVRALTLR